MDGWMHAWMGAWMMHGWVDGWMVYDMHGWMGRTAFLSRTLFLLLHTLLTIFVDVARLRFLLA